VHIFWQRRIRAGDTTTPYWFPSQTSSGSIREDRLVFPIPPGVHWKDAMPRILPGDQTPKLEAKNAKPKVQRAKAPPPALRGLWFTAPKPEKPEAKPKRAKKTAVKNDPQLVAAARELRDRWLEQINSGEYLPRALGKYEVTRALASAAEPGQLIQIAPALPAPLAA
jgi:hypothetical protein